MSSSHYYNNLINDVFVEESVSGSPVVERIRGYAPAIPVTVISGREDIPEDKLNGKTLFVSSPRGKVLGSCPGSKGHHCCNYLTLDLYLGCSLGCTYCIMKSYLNFSPLTVYADTKEGLKAIRDVAQNNPGRPVRVGTGEVGDSLLLDPLCDLSRECIEALNDLPNLYFELKTKTHFVDHLLDISKKGNTVIGFSLNPPSTIEAEEGIASSLDERLAAAGRAAGAGYKLSFHFDPVFQTSDWRERYLPVVEGLGLFSGSVVWVSLGTFRYPPSLQEKIDDRPYLYDEFVQSRDGKYRYIQRSRIRIYREMVEAIRRNVNAPIYLCMESDAVWEKVFGSPPNKLPELRFLWDRVPIPAG